MAVVAVAEDSARYDAMEVLTNVISIGGTAQAIEVDFFYTGTASISKKVTTTNVGFTTSTGANRNMTLTGRKTWLVKVWVTNYAVLTATGLEVRIGSTSAGNANYHQYRLASTLAGEAYPAKGGWVIQAIDPNVAAHRTSTNGTPVLTAVNAYATLVSLSATSKSENLAMDAVDVGAGLYLTGGDGADADGDFNHFVTDDEGTVVNGRFGYVTTQGGVLFVLGRLIIGATSASLVRTAAATGFTDNGRVVVFPDNLADVGFSGLTVDLGNVSTAVTWTGCSFLGRGRTSPDTRPYFEVFGTTSTAGLVATGCTFRAFSQITLTSKVNLTSCTLAACQALTHAGATINKCVVDTHPTATGVGFITTADPTLISNTTFNNTGGTGHAIVITAPGTYSFTGNTFTGYGASGSTNAAIYNNSGGAVVLNITGGGGVPTVRNGTGASTTVNANVSITLTGLKDNTEVRVYASGTTTELAGIDDATAGTAGNRSFTFSLAVGTLVDIRIHSVTYESMDILSFTMPATDGTIPVSQRFDRNYNNP